MLGTRPQLSPEDDHPHTLKPHETEVVDDVKDGEDGEDDEPEPEEDIDLLVEDVDGQDALSVMSLNVATGTILVKCTLGHPGKHSGHGVSPPLLLQLNK